MKSISTINPAIMENMECSIIKAHSPVKDLDLEVQIDSKLEFHNQTACSNYLENLYTLLQS